MQEIVKGLFSHVSFMTLHFLEGIISIQPLIHLPPLLLSKAYGMLAFSILPKLTNTIGVTGLLPSENKKGFQKCSY
jgi:hypothetical protein